MSRKRLLIVLVVAVALGAVGLFALLSNLNDLVAAAIEKHGSSATGTRVAVSGVDVSLREGRGGVSGLRVGSPSGYEAADAFRLGGITIDLDVTSVRKDPIVIERLEINAPEIFVEFHKDGSSNLSQIRRHLEQFTPARGDSRGGEGKPAPQKRIRIREFVVAEGKIAVDASALGIDARSVKLPTFRLTDVGGPGGAVPDELAKDILTSIASKATTEIGRSEIDRQIRGALGGSLEKAKGLLDQIRK